MQRRAAGVQRDSGSVQRACSGVQRTSVELRGERTEGSANTHFVFSENVLAALAYMRGTDGRVRPHLQIQM